jgi:hypothetical protein
MGGNNLSVKITADQTDLVAKFAIAKASVSGFSAELNKLARASAAGIIDAGGQQLILVSAAQASPDAGEADLDPSRIFRLERGVLPFEGSTPRLVAHIHKN